MAVKLSGDILSFTDGGVADNRGLSECERAGGMGLISDAAVFETVDSSVGTDPISVAARVSGIIYSRAENERTENIIQSSPYQGLALAMIRGMTVDGESSKEEGAYYEKMLKEPIIFGYKQFDSLLYWAEIRKSVSYLNAKDETLTEDATYILDHLDKALCHAMIPTRLKGLDRDVQDNIVNMGYLSALSAIEMRMWSARYKRYWIDNTNTPEWRATNFPVLMFDPPRKAKKVIERLGACDNQEWVSAFVASTRLDMEPLSAALRSAHPSGLLPISRVIVDEELSDQLAKAFLEALENRLEEDKAKASSTRPSN